MNNKSHIEKFVALKKQAFLRLRDPIKEHFHTKVKEEFGQIKTASDIQTIDQTLYLHQTLP